MYIDTHTHMDHRRFDSDRKSTIQTAKDSGIGILVNPAIEYETNYRMRQMLDGYDWIYYGVGIHPNRVGADDTNDEEWEAGLMELAVRDNAKVVAIGETGLDFHRLNRNSAGEIDESGVIALSRQYKWFRRQIQLASMARLPLILHIRNANESLLCESMHLDKDTKWNHIDAHKEAIKILKEYQEDLQLDVKGVVHCYSSSDFAVAKEYIDMGYMLGIGGTATYSGNGKLREILKKIPLTSIVLETDSPYVMPEGLAGKRNTPLNIPYIAKNLAEIKEIDVTEVEEITTQNARRLFGL